MSQGNGTIRLKGRIIRPDQFSQSNIHRLIGVVLHSTIELVLTLNVFPMHCLSFNPVMDRPLVRPQSD